MRLFNCSLWENYTYRIFSIQNLQDGEKLNKYDCTEDEIIEMVYMHEGLQDDLKYHV